MLCKACGSIIERKFKGEIGVRSSELNDLARPSVWLFPELFVCLDCGATELTAHKTELHQLTESDVATTEAPHSNH